MIDRADEPLFSGSRNAQRVQRACKQLGPLFLRSLVFRSTGNGIRFCRVIADLALMSLHFPAKTKDASLGTDRRRLENRPRTSRPRELVRVISSRCAPFCGETTLLTIITPMTDSQL
ncbi:unnamed protein product, partial [Iphiclides podalirius]